MNPTPVLRSADVACDPDTAFGLFTDRIAAWWPLATHGLFGDESGGVAFVDGRLVERSLDGRTTVWGEVLVWDRPRQLVVTWHPGRPDGPGTEVDIRFHATDDGTRVELTHRGWEAFGEDGVARRRTYVGPNAWGYVLDHYGDAAEAETGPAADRTAALRGAYEAFFAEALAGGFGAPAPGEWTAEQVVAHVAVNDDAMSAVCRSLVHGKDVRFTNDRANDVALLDGVATAMGHLDGLVAIGRDRAAQLCTLLDRLDEEQLATPVPCRLQDHGTVVLDDSLPWNRLAIDTQTGLHLPLHTTQLAALRPS